MEKLDFRIVLEMRWELIVNATSQEEAAAKAKEYLKGLIPRDGYTTMAMKAIEDLDKSRYKIEHFIGFIVP